MCIYLKRVLCNEENTQSSLECVQKWCYIINRSFRQDSVCELIYLRDF